VRAERCTTALGKFLRPIQFDNPCAEEWGRGTERQECCEVRQKPWPLAGNPVDIEKTGRYARPISIRRRFVRHPSIGAPIRTIDASISIPSSRVEQGTSPGQGGETMKSTERLECLRKDIDDLVNRYQSEAHQYKNQAFRLRIMSVVLASIVTVLLGLKLDGNMLLTTIFSNIALVLSAAITVLGA
jgi:hypothetical protein